MASDPNESIDIQICTLPWDQVECDAFVVPTNSEGVMSHFPASKIRDLAGREVEDLVREHTPLAIGAAFVTHGGRMKARNLIHVPDTDKPGGKVQVEDILRATAAVIIAAKVKSYGSVAIPLMGAFESGIPAEEAARAIHSEFKSYRGDTPLKVLLMARDHNDVEVFELAMEGGIP
ncbi:MAG TPA: macro domain-containing protein [Nannocystaceae bacterium]|nr:macro domain-containing protein [Nannocystaceae bacterium]